MNVVAAGVHDADVVAVFVGGADVAGVGAAGVFDDRQSVEVGAHQDGGPGAVFQDGDEAVAPDVGRHVEAQRLEFGDQLGRGFLFVKGKFGMLVQVGVELQTSEVFFGGRQFGDSRLQVGRRRVSRP